MIESCQAKYVEPVQDCVQWTGDNFEEVRDFIKGARNIHPISDESMNFHYQCQVTDDCLSIPFLEAPVTISKNSWIVKTNKNTIDVYTKFAFETKYAPISSRLKQIPHSRSVPDRFYILQGEAIPYTSEDVSEVISFLDKSAVTRSKASKMLAEDKSLRQEDNPGQDKNIYSGGEIHEMYEYKAARILHSQEEEIKRLKDLLKNPPKHDFWRPGEILCPRGLKVGNGELHTLKCKKCGLENPKSELCLDGIHTT